MIVDAHHHLWDLDRGYAWLDEPSLAPIRRTRGLRDLEDVTSASGVARTVLVEAGRCEAGETVEFLALAGHSDLIAGVVGWAPLTDPLLTEILARYLVLPGADKLVGIRDQVQAEPDPDYLDLPEVRAGLATVTAAGLVNELVVRVDQLPACGRAAQSFPGASFVLDHLGKPEISAGAEGLSRWRTAITGLARRPNAFAKVSGLVTEADWRHWTVEDLRPFVETAVELFGPERLIFGSDWPVCELAASYGQVLETAQELLSGLSEAERAGVLGGNAMRVYGLAEVE